MFSVRNKTKSTLPRVPFDKIKDTALGKDYFLSLVFVGERTSRKLNKTYRGKDKSTNILSFSLEKNEGEIFICPKIAKKEGFGVANLFIHGLLHLKGMKHGSTMSKAEIKLCKKFDV